MRTTASRLLCLLFAGAAVAAAQVQPVIAPAKRAEALALAGSLLAARDAAPAAVKNPFHTDAFASGQGPGPAADTAAAGPAAPRTGRDLLASIAEGLRPSGFFVLGGAQTLVFGQKRVKAGERLTINFEGQEYTVVITAISPPNFTFRLGNEEFTRPIR